MRAAKVDQNQPDIVGALRAAGASVESLARIGAGCPDLAVGYKGKNFLLEVKMPGGDLNPAQRLWFKSWRGAVRVVRSVDEALEAIGAKPMSPGVDVVLFPKRRTK